MGSMRFHDLKQIAWEGNCPLLTHVEVQFYCLETNIQVLYEETSDTSENKKPHL